MKDISARHPQNGGFIKRKKQTACCSVGESAEFSTTNVSSLSESLPSSRISRQKAGGPLTGRTSSLVWKLNNAHFISVYPDKSVWSNKILHMLIKMFNLYFLLKCIIKFKYNLLYNLKRYEMMFTKHTDISPKKQFTYHLPRWLWRVCHHGLILVAQSVTLVPGPIWKKAMENNGLLIQSASLMATMDQIECLIIWRIWRIHHDFKICHLLSLVFFL